MTTKLFILSAIATVTLFSFSSCSKEGDTTKPTIELSEPEDGEEVLPGSTMCIEMDLSDDTSLASFKINIHNAFDGHDHSNSETKHSDEGSDYNSDKDNAFAYEMTSEQLNESIEGLKNSHKHIHIEIPDSAAYGDYHLMVYCFDSAGNESFVARSIAIAADAADHEHEHEEE